jgi:2-polyprenyl-3-methyl-5-hydroxy-6-metoxy-1,4-benzoquinol methylase
MHDVKGIDLASRLIDIAKQRAAKRKLDNVRFSVEDRDDLKEEPESFDVLTCFSSIYSGDGEFRGRSAEACANFLISKRLEAFANLLKPKGHLVLSIPTSIPNTIMHDYTKESYRMKMEYSGFKDIKTRSKGIMLKDAQFGYLIVSGKKKK